MVTESPFDGTPEAGEVITPAQRLSVFVVERENWDYDEAVSWTVLAHSASQAKDICRRLREVSATEKLVVRQRSLEGKPRIVHTAVHHG